MDAPSTPRAIKHHAQCTRETLRKPYAICFMCQQARMDARKPGEKQQRPHSCLQTHGSKVSWLGEQNVHTLCRLEGCCAPATLSVHFYKHPLQFVFRLLPARAGRSSSCTPAPWQARLRTFFVRERSCGNALESKTGVCVLDKLFNAER